jgi:hypothetical protein
LVSNRGGWQYDGGLALEPCSKSRTMETTIHVDLVVSVIIQM